MNVHLNNLGLEIELDGSRAYFNYYWLRDNCPSGWDADTQERVFDILQQPDDLRALSADIEGQLLRVVWPDGHQSEYSLEWLRQWQAGDLHNDPAIRHRRPWYSDHYAAMQRFDYIRLMQSEAALADWARCLLEEGVCLVLDMPDSNSALQSLCERLGHVRPTFSGYCFDVKAKQQPVSLSYTAAALELHTDIPAEELPPGIQFLHCRVNDVSGGDSFFVDAVAVANDLKQMHPDYFATLTQLKVPFRYTDRDHDVRARQKIIELDAEIGEVSGINFSQHMAGVFDLPPSQMDEFYPAFRKFGQMLQHHKYLMSFRLNAGECIVFDNHRVAHGRSAYDETSGDRYLRGCYIDRGELRSTYRVLCSRHDD